MTNLGVSGGLACTGNGTLGILVKHASQPGRKLLLSCSHVVARSGNFAVNFESLFTAERIVQQPVPFACDRSVNRIGVLINSPAPFSVLKKGSETNGDFALVLLDEGISSTITPVQRITNNWIKHYLKESPASWHGRTVRLLGALRRDEADALGKIVAMPEKGIDVDFSGVGVVRVKGAIEYEVRCEKGDSGAAVIDEQNQLLGLHIAGKPARGTGVFLPVADFMTKHALQLVERGS